MDALAYLGGVLPARKTDRHATRIGASGDGVRRLLRNLNVVGEERLSELVGKPGLGYHADELRSAVGGGKIRFHDWISVESAAGQVRTFHKLSFVFRNA